MEIDPNCSVVAVRLLKCVAVWISTTQALQGRKFSQPGKSLLAKPCTLRSWWNFYYPEIRCISAHTRRCSLSAEIMHWVGQRVAVTKPAGEEYTRSLSSFSAQFSWNITSSKKFSWKRKLRNGNDIGKGLSWNMLLENILGLFLSLVYQWNDKIGWISNRKI